jgi:hypothetical protein
MLQYLENVFRIYLDLNEGREPVLLLGLLHFTIFLFHLILTKGTIRLHFFSCRVSGFVNIRKSIYFLSGFYLAHEFYGKRHLKINAIKLIELMDDEKIAV